jgi:hypothetical protein
MTSLPAQHPDTPPRYRFRAKGDRLDRHYWRPKFDGPFRLDVDRYEPTEPDPWEPDTLSLRDLLDVPWGRAGVVVALVVVGLIVFLGSGPMPV